MEIKKNVEEQLAVINKLSIEVGMQPIEFMDVLGLLPPCSATTVEEAYVEYWSFSFDCPEKRAALISWNKFLLKQIAATTTVDETKAIRDKSPKGSAAERAATVKIYELYLEGK